jgi:hypothetical protein
MLSHCKACGALHRGAEVLTNPEIHWPAVWEPQRLIVQHMNGLELRYPSESVDAVFSSSSIEHFGRRGGSRARGAGDVARATSPGRGVPLDRATVVRTAAGLPGVLLFDRSELERAIVGAAPWELLSPLDTSVTPATMATAQPFEQAAADVRAHVAQHGRLRFDALDWSRYPHIVLVEGERSWTSVHLALRKPGDEPASAGR